MGKTLTTVDIWIANNRIRDHCHSAEVKSGGDPLC